jgi:hypothetical protein
MGRIILRIFLFVVLLVVVVGGAGGGLFYAFNQHFYFAAPKAEYSKPASALEAQRQDLDYFHTLIDLDRSFAPEARAEAERLIAMLQRMPQVLPEPKLHVALMRIAALADNGHTRMRSGVDGRNVLMLPLRIAPFAEGFFVMRAKAAYADMLGGRVESIDGMPFDAILKTLETMRGGTERFRRGNAAMFIADQELLYGAGIARDPAQSTWIVRLADGRLITHTLTADLEKDQPRFTYGPRWRSPAPMKEMGQGWAAANLASGSVPLSEQDMDTLFFRAAVPDACVEYVRIEAIEDTNGQHISPFLNDTEAALRAHPPCAVILDLRGDGGGDYTNMWHFTHALPDLVAPGGHIYVLTDPMTFSAAITSTAFTKEAGGERVTIIGEPVGDRLVFYAEGGGGTLPNSKLSQSFETGKHDYAHPCSEWHDCFWLNWIYPVRVKTLEPDIAAPESFADWSHGHDTAFETAVALANRNDTRR